MSAMPAFSPMGRTRTNVADQASGMARLQVNSAAYGAD